jgi:phosphoribosylformylglycinamidine cyclo-ligase
MAMEQEKSKYAEAGVDIEKANRLIEILKPITRKTYKPGVMTDIGRFAGLFSINTQDIREPVLVSSTDGVGTKLKLAFMLDKHDTIGIDLVAMCVNDIVVEGATPLFLLDYISMGNLDLRKVEEIVKGIAAGCQEAQCSLIGGETAEMPGLYAQDEYDLAGFVVGIADKQELIDGSEIAVGYQLIGIGSSGLHSNGFSLARNVFFEKLKMSVSDYVEDFGKTLGEELLTPTKIYARTLMNLRRDFRIYGISHITGGGITDNLPRALPKACKAVIRRTSWERQPIFPYIQKGGEVSEQEMLRTFNNGLGLIIVVNQDQLSDVIMRLQAMGETAYHIGSIEERGDAASSVEFLD